MSEDAVEVLFVLHWYLLPSSGVVADSMDSKIQKMRCEDGLVEVVSG
jgi:hypothetical protein